MKDREKEIYKKVIERLNNAPNNMEFRQQSYEDLQRMKKELDKCAEKGVEISEECKDYYRKKFASLSIAKSMMENNDD